MKKGKFISIEGFDGVGKTTIIRRLKTLFPEAVFVKEPGTTPFGKVLRRLLKGGTFKLEPYTEKLLFTASMVETSIKIIKPALNEGKHVFTDRWHYSTKAYQCFPYGKMGEFTDMINNLGGVSNPDINIILSAPFDVCIARQSGPGRKKDKYESSELSYLQRVYLYYATECPGIPVDATKPISEMLNDINMIIRYGENE